MDNLLDPAPKSSPALVPVTPTPEILAEGLFSPASESFAPECFSELFFILTKCNECRRDLLEYVAMKKKQEVSPCH